MTESASSPYRTEPPQRVARDGQRQAKSSNPTGYCLKLGAYGSQRIMYFHGFFFSGDPWSIAPIIILVLIRPDSVSGRIRDLGAHSRLTANSREYPYQRSSTAGHSLQYGVSQAVSAAASPHSSLAAASEYNATLRSSEVSTRSYTQIYFDYV